MIESLLTGSLGGIVGALMLLLLAKLGHFPTLAILVTDAREFKKMTKGDND